MRSNFILWFRVKWSCILTDLHTINEFIIHAALREFSVRIENQFIHTIWLVRAKLIISEIDFE